MVLKYERLPLAVNTGERTRIELPPRVFRVRLTGLLFETNKTFLLPGAMGGIRGLVDFYGSHPQMGIVITGHADRVGSAWHNLALSEERAEAMAQFLTDDVDGWLDHYHGGATSSAWGLREDQHMLAAVPDGGGGPYYAGPVHGWLDEVTRDAVARFQTDNGISGGGTPNAETRRALIEAYMGLDGTTLPEGVEVAQLGCGENHNAVETADAVDVQENRRVEIFLFDSGDIQPPVPGSCSGDGCAYESWLQATLETIDFEDALAELLVRVIGHREGSGVELLPDTDVELVRAGFPARKAKSDGNGQVRFADLTSGSWSVYAQKEDFTTDSKEIEVHPGGFVLLGAESDPEPEAKSNLVGSSGTTNAVETGAVLMNLQDDRFIVRWVDEPSITPDAQEEADEWSDDLVHIHPNASPAVGVADEDLDGLFVLPRGSSTKATVRDVYKSGPHETSVKWRVEVGDVLPGRVTEMKVSSRLRMSTWVFHSPFVKAKSGNDDITIDDETIELMGESCLDDISIVSTIGWVPFTNEVGWHDHAPGGEVKRSAKYLKKVVDALHGKNIQVQAGWSSVDVKTGNKPYNVGWTNYLASATPVKIRALAQSAWDFFEKQGIDIDGIGFDFEINSLGQKQAENLALLYRTTAEIFRQNKRDAFVTYANAPFATDGTGKPGFMNIQPFSLCQGVSNLFARPMCFDEHTVAPEEIREGVACAVRRAAGGGGLHPSQAQFGLFARELENMSAFKTLITETLRPNRIGLMLYQLPKFEVQNSMTGQFTRLAITKFLKDCKTWNELLNPGEALPPTAGQPLQVPRAVDFGI